MFRVIHPPGGATTNIFMNGIIFYSLLIQSKLFFRILIYRVQINSYQILLNDRRCERGNAALYYWWRRQAWSHGGAGARQLIALVPSRSRGCLVRGGLVVISVA